MLLLLLFTISGCSKNEGVNEEPKVEFETVLLSDNTMQITKYIGVNNVVMVPEQIDGRTVTEIWNNTFANLSIEEITLPSTIRRVGVNIFMNSAKLRVINIQGDEPFYLESFALDSRQLDHTTGYLEIRVGSNFKETLIEFNNQIELDPTSDLSIEMEQKYGGTWISYIDLLKNR